MKLLKKILVAMERDESSRQALKTAAAWAKTFDAELLLVHVLPGLALGPEVRHYEARIEAQRAEAVAVMSGWEKEALAEGAEQVTTEVRSGLPQDEINLAASAAGASLIICGSGDRRQGDHRRLGTTAERLVRHSEKPVLVQCSESKPAPKTILCPVDLSETSARALRNSLYIASAFDADLIALFVNHHDVGSTTMPAHLAREIMDDWDKMREQDLAKFLFAFDLKSVRFRREVREGRPAEQILAAINDFRADLTIMGSVGRTGLARIFLGSVAQKVVREMPCAIMTVKQENVLAVELIDEVREIERHYRSGVELLKSGEAEEAKMEFAFCLSRDRLFAPAWEGMARAAELCGDQEEAREARERAEVIMNTIGSLRAGSEARAAGGPRRPRKSAVK